MKRLLALALLALLSSSAFAQTSTISALPAGTTLGGTESIPMDQTGCATPATCKTSPAAIDTYVLGQGVPLTALPTQASPTILGNVSGSTATPLALNPLAISIVQYAPIVADVIATSNITLSGTQTIDGVALNVGQAVLASAQTSSVNNGIYIVQSGAWTRAANFPSGYVIPQSCDVVVLVLEGTANGLKTYKLTTSGGALTIGTSNLLWGIMLYGSNTLPVGSTTALGMVKTTSALATLDPVAQAVGTFTATDCISANDATGGIVDHGDANGQKGECALTNSATGHLIINNGGFPPSASAGTLNANSTDHWFVVTGLSGATTLTITFGSAWPNLEACDHPGMHATTGGVPATVDVNAGTASVVYTFSAAFTGTLNGHCFGTN